MLWFILSEYPLDECSMFGDVVFMRWHKYSQCFDLFFQSILQMSVQCLGMLCLWDAISTLSALIYSFRVSSRWVFYVWWCCVYEMASLLSVLWFILSEYPPYECSMFGDVVFMRCHQNLVYDDNAGHCRYHMSRNMRFPTMWYVRPAKPQISLRICPVWSEVLQVAWVFYDC